MSASIATPEGYVSWLDYAVETFDTRRLVTDALFVDDQTQVDCETVRAAARQELRDLRLKAEMRSG